MSKSILHIIGQLTCGGAERQLCLVAHSLKKIGWAQTVVVLSEGGIWKGYLGRNGIPVYEIRRSSIKPLRLWRLWRLLREKGPKIVMSWSLHAGIYAHWLGGIGKPARIFAVRGDYRVDSSTALPNKLLAFGRHAIEKADHIISNSAWGLAALKERGLKILNSSVIPNIVIPRGRAKVSKAVVSPKIVAAGGLKRLKGFDILFRALAIVAQKGYQFELMVAGKGPEKCRLDGLAVELGLTNKIRLLGEIDDVPTLFATAQMAVHPSRSEGLSNAILEAMAEGLPVVATNAGGTPEIITNNVNGLIVPADDPESLAKGICQCLGDGELRLRLGQAALRWVQDNCSESKIVNSYDDVIGNLI